MVRAVRKLTKNGNAHLLNGVQIIYLTKPVTARTAGQEAMAKAVATIWGECLNTGGLNNAQITHNVRH